METTREHPSNRLARGEAQTFQDAIDLFRQAVRREMQWDREHNAAAWLPAEMRNDWHRQIAIANAALNEYHEAEQAVRAAIADRVATSLAAQFPGHEDEYAPIIEALRDGDYTRMAF